MLIKKELQVRVRFSSAQCEVLPKFHTKTRYQGFRKALEKERTLNGIKPKWQNIFQTILTTLLCWPKNKKS
jgi:hypothetical protein